MRCCSARPAKTHPPDHRRHLARVSRASVPLATGSRPRAPPLFLLLHCPASPVRLPLLSYRATAAALAWSTALLGPARCRPPRRARPPRAPPMPLRPVARRTTASVVRRASAGRSPPSLSRPRPGDQGPSACRLAARSPAAPLRTTWLRTIPAFHRCSGGRLPDCRVGNGRRFETWREACGGASRVARPLSAASDRRLRPPPPTGVLDRRPRPAPARTAPRLAVHRTPHRLPAEPYTAGPQTDRGSRGRRPLRPPGGRCVLTLDTLAGYRRAKRPRSTGRGRWEPEGGSVGHMIAGGGVRG